MKTAIVNLVSAIDDNLEFKCLIGYKVGDDGLVDGIEEIADFDTDEDISHHFCDKYGEFYNNLKDEIIGEINGYMRQESAEWLDDMMYQADMHRRER